MCPLGLIPYGGSIEFSHSMTDITMAMVCAIMSVEWCI